MKMMQRAYGQGRVGFNVFGGPCRTEIGTKSAQSNRLGKGARERCIWLAAKTLGGDYPHS